MFIEHLAYKGSLHLPVLARQVAALQKQERRQRQRGEAAEREAARLQDELQAAREEATHLGKAATNAQLAAAEAERTLLDQVGVGEAASARWFQETRCGMVSRASGLRP